MTNCPRKLKRLRRKLRQVNDDADMLRVARKAIDDCLDKLMARAGEIQMKMARLDQ